MMNFKKYIYNSLLFLFISLLLFSIIFLRSWHIFGPISVRNFSAIILFIIALRVTIFKKNYFNFNIKLYFLWVSIYVFLNLITGNIFSEEVYKNLVAYHIVSIILIYSIPKLINNSKTINIIIVSFIIFYVFNSYVTYLQFNNDALGWLIGEYISPMNDTKSMQLETYYTFDTMLSYSMCTGLNGFVVTNGQYVASFLPLASFLIWSKKNIQKIIGLLIFILGGLTIFYVQQRMGLIIFIVYLAILILYRMNLISKYFLFVFAILIIATYTKGINVDDYGRLLDFSDSTRSHTFEHLDKFLSNSQYFWLGNPLSQNGTENHAMLLTLGHNSFLDSLRRGGIFGFLLYLILFISLLREFYIIFIDKFKNRYYRTLALCLCAFFSLLYSITHSDGIPSGSVFFWLPYSLMLASDNIDKNNDYDKSV